MLRVKWGSGELVPWLGILVILPEDLGAVPNAHMELGTDCNSSFGVSDSLF